MAKIMVFNQIKRFISAYFTILKLNGKIMSEVH